MQTILNVINPIDDSEVEVTLDVNVNITITSEGKKLLMVSANGVIELP